MHTSMVGSKVQLCVVGNYQLTGRLLGKGHFARVEEAQHKILGKKVALKIIDTDLIHEEYVKRNLHREARVMSKLRHPCIAMLYETMMAGSRLYLVMEEANGGDLYTYVLASSRTRVPVSGGSRGIHEKGARNIAIQLVSAVNHMHACGVVHRDLKMENIMLDHTKQNIKIVDFGLSNMYSKEEGLSTPCGSLEYAAPELFISRNKYGPEVDLWSLGVIVYAMLTGSLPFRTSAGCTGAGEGRQRPQLQRSIIKGFGPKQKQALAHASFDCREFIQSLLQPKIDSRMTICGCCRHPWIKKGGRTINPNPFPPLRPAALNILYKQIGGIFNLSSTEVQKKIISKPYGDVGGYLNIKTHHQLLLRSAGREPLWSTTTTRSENTSSIFVSQLLTPYKNLSGLILNPHTLIRPKMKERDLVKIKSGDRRMKKLEVHVSRLNTASPRNYSNSLLTNVRVKIPKTAEQPERNKKLSRQPRTIKSAGCTKDEITLRKNSPSIYNSAVLNPCCVANAIVKILPPRQKRTVK